MWHSAQGKPTGSIGASIFGSESAQIDLRQLFETLPVAAYTCDAEGLITYFNRQAVVLWDRTPKLNDPAERYCGSWRLFSGEGAPITHDQCWMALALRKNREFVGHEVVIQRPSGERRTVLAHACPIRDVSGELNGAVNVLVDITDRKRGEAALRDADRAKDEFLATLAHELRNPLAAVRNALQIMRLNAPGSADARWAVDIVDRQMQQMTRMVDDLLDVTRISRNRLELRKRTVELSEVVRMAVETSRPLIDAGGHELTLVLPPQPLRLDADPARLAQAVANLLNNAAKYTNAGGHIRLTLERQGSDALVRVRDTGIGIAPESLPRLFEMFIQVDRSLGHSQGGLGIGLTLVKRLVTMHGGSVEAYSDGPGKGSEFVIRLPINVEPASMLSLPAPQTTSSPGRRAAVPLAPLRVLIVDDNRDSANSLAILLRLTGHNARAAYDGLEALELAGDFQPHAVVLDIGMPRLNGYEAAQRMRQQPWSRGATFIAVTGWGQEGDRQRATEAGFDHHIVKPVEPDALLELLGSLDARVSE